MLRTPVLSLLTALLCLGGAILPASAAAVDCDGTYCFSPEDFSSETSVTGICITGLPESGTVMLGSRVLRAGDILTADQVSRMTFSPQRTETDCDAQMEFLPVLAGGTAEADIMTISIRGKVDNPPVAEDSTLETYKNLSVTGRLKVTDPEGQAMTFTVTRQPKRGDLALKEDGSFTYTPKKNKVGVDSFTFTASDPAGKVSREATVTIHILKPTDATQYTDTAGKDCRFAAEWMRHTGIFAGEQLAGQPCFHPDKEVTRGEFVTMLVKALDIPAQEEVTFTGYTDEIPLWLQPYLAAAVRSGLTAGLPEPEVFDAAAPITGAEAALMLHNALDLAVPRTDAEADATLPAWAETAVSTLSENGFALEADAVLTRGETAQILYQAAQMNTRSVFAE